MNMTPKIALFVSGCVAIALVSCQDNSIKYPQLHNLIEEATFIDVHAHPVLGHRAYSAKDPNATLEPLIGRPGSPEFPDEGTRRCSGVYASHILSKGGSTIIRCSITKTSMIIGLINFNAFIRIVYSNIRI